MPIKKMLSAILVALTVTLLSLGVTSVASAAMAQRFVEASDCLTGDALPSDIVAQPYYSGGYFNLRCGDETKGIIHIDQSHPISETGSDDSNIPKCAQNILQYGHEVPAEGEFNQAARIRGVAGGTATLVWDTNIGDVITMYTSDSNNWAACAAYVP